MTVDEVARLALALPEAVEAPHFDMSSFRVRGKIFATVPPGGEHVHVFVEPDEVPGWVAEDPATFEELHWGAKLSGVRVRLAAASSERVAEALEDAWRRKAPRRLVTSYDADRT